MQSFFSLFILDGTEEMYSHMDFSPGDGKLLASVGGNPDYMLTVWDWEREKTVLRSKAFSQDIYRVTFSPENANQLTTSGTGHIRLVSHIIIRPMLPEVNSGIHALAHPQAIHYIDNGSIQGPCDSCMCKINTNGGILTTRNIHYFCIAQTLYSDLHLIVSVCSNPPAGVFPP